MCYKVISLPLPRQAGLEELLALLNNNQDNFANNISQISGALTALNPRQHSLAWAHVLYLQCTMSQIIDRDAFIQNCARLLLEFNAAQVRMDVIKFAKVCVVFKEVCIEMSCPSRAILPLRDAITTLQPTPEHLTPQHADFFQCCLLAKAYSAALPILDKPIFEVVPPLTGLTPRDFLLYCYYGGMVYIGLRRYADAADMFLHAISAPAVVMNAIVVAVYKKFILTSLIAVGSLPSFPRYTAAVVQRHLKSSCTKYLALADAYKSKDVTELRRAATEHAQAFATDANTGIVELCVQSLYKRNIQRLTQTYLTLSLADIAQSVQLVSPQKAEACVLQMIEAGEIFATINQKDGMVSFHEDAEQYDTASMATRLDAEVSGAMNIAARVKVVDEAVMCDKAFLTRVAEASAYRRDVGLHDAAFGGTAAGSGPSMRNIDI